MSFDVLLHPYIQCQTPSFVLLFTVSSISPRLNRLSLLLPISMVELCLVDSMASEFGSVVDLTQSLGSPLSDA
jgi:hypothetical protein